MSVYNLVSKNMKRIHSHNIKFSPNPNLTQNTMTLKETTQKERTHTEKIYKISHQIKIKLKNHLNSTIKSVLFFVYFRDFVELILKLDCCIIFIWESGDIY